MRGDGDVEPDRVLPALPYGGSGRRGWKTSAKGKVWRCVDKTAAPLSGITGFEVVDKGMASPGQVRVSLTAKNGSYPVIDGDQPLQMIVVLGDQADASAGHCGESDLGGPDCRFNGAQSTLSCKR